MTWEKTKTFNVGVDASFFNNALNVTFDYFYKRTSDILMKPLVPSVFGTDMAMDNIGEMQNQGWDLSINYRLKRELQIITSTSILVTLGMKC